MFQENAVFVSECSEDMCLVKNGSNMHLGDDGAKELVIICDHVHFSLKNKGTQDCRWSPEVGGQTHVTLIQEMIVEWAVSVPKSLLISTKQNVQLRLMVMLLALQVKLDLAMESHVTLRLIQFIPRATESISFICRVAGLVQNLQVVFAPIVKERHSHTLQKIY